MDFADKSRTSNCRKLDSGAPKVTRVRPDPWITNRIGSKFDAKLDLKMEIVVEQEAYQNQIKFMD